MTDWRQQRRPLGAALVLAVVAVLVLAVGFPGARLVAGGCVVVAVGCILAVRHQVLRRAPRTGRPGRLTGARRRRCRPGRLATQGGGQVWGRNDAEEDVR